ncbi:MAG: beta-propeller domain-containing protein [Bacilli bacterium]|jgi:uncharacterized secreted protein with C-terminal beta-propeller domain
MKNFKKEIKEQGRAYFQDRTPDFDFSNKLVFTTPTGTPSPKRTPKWRPLVWKGGSLLTALAASLAIGAVIISDYKDNRNPNDYGLAQVQDVDQLRDLIDSYSWRSGVPEVGYNTDGSSLATTESPADDQGDNEGSGHSETNVQVEGVDEGDIIKVDDDRIYKISYNRLQVIDVLEEGQMEVILDQSMDSLRDEGSYTYFSDIYLSEDYLVVIGQRYEIFTYEYQDGEAAIDCLCYYWGIPQTMVYLYNLDDLELAHEIELNGYYLTTRMIGERLYIISNHQPYFVDEDDDPRPVFRVDEEVIVPEFSDIKYMESLPTETFTIIATIFLDQEINSEALGLDIFLGNASWGIVYVSHQAIYLASYYYYYSVIGDSYGYNGLLMSYLFEEDGTVTFGGAGTYKGWVLNQFAIDEYDGYLRMVTTDGWGSSAKNRLYVYERQTIDEKRFLTQVALIDEGIGEPGETVRSVRFNEDAATIVTYEITDPLYTVDLSDPLHPTIEAGLKVSGYATYQHVWAPNLILGIGYESEGNDVFGLKLTLFDVSDLENPVVVGEPLVLWNEDYGWQWSEALYNHKALLVDIELGLLGFSISSYYYGVAYDWIYLDNYYVFNVDPSSETPITIEAVISHSGFAIEHQDELVDRYGYFSYWSASITRAVYIGSYLFAVSDMAVTAHDMDEDYAQVASVDLMVDPLPILID